jgi:predicted metal-dependent enzyme (double-stranded beta helix superfamily)
MQIPQSLERLISLIDQHLTEEKNLTPSKARQLVLDADVQVEDMMHYAAFDHPVADCYGRKLVFANDHFEVMVMSWNPRDYSSIHNHGYTEWGVVQVFGPTHHFIYQLKDKQLSFSKKEFLLPGQAISVNNALIHQMGNATSKPYMTLHVYGSNTKSEGITADAKNFDLEQDRVALTCGGAFFNLPEEAVHSIEPGVIPTQEVFTHYAFLLIDYLNRQAPGPRINALKKTVLQKLSRPLVRLPQEERVN